MQIFNNCDTYVISIFVLFFYRPHSDISLAIYLLLAYIRSSVSPSPSFFIYLLMHYEYLLLVSPWMEHLLSILKLLDVVNM